MAFQSQNQNPTQLFSYQMRSGLSWRLFVFFLITFVIAILSYAGLEYGYKTFLNKSIASYDAALEEARTKIGISEQKNLIAFYSQIVNLKSLFSSHVFGSRIFTFLESTTNLKVAYTSANLSTKDMQLSLDGVTDSYETLVSQLATFENAKEVDSVVLGTNSFDGVMVKFSVKIIFRPSFFLLTASKANPLSP